MIDNRRHRRTEPSRVKPAEIEANEMNFYVCQTCRLCFKIGYMLHGDLSDGYQRLVCDHCGTCHQINHIHSKPDELCSQLEPCTYRNDSFGDSIPFAEWPLRESLPTS